MDYAIIKIGGKQYKVQKGDVLEVDRLGEKNKKFKLEEVLLISQDGKVRVGAPTVKGSSLVASVLDDKKGKKVRVSKFKSKVRYRRTIGFRPLLSRIKIEEIKF